MSRTFSQSHGFYVKLYQFSTTNFTSPKSSSSQLKLWKGGCTFSVIQVDTNAISFIFTMSYPEVFSTRTHTPKPWSTDLFLLANLLFKKAARLVKRSCSPSNPPIHPSALPWQSSSLPLPHPHCMASIRKSVRNDGTLRSSHRSNSKWVCVFRCLWTLTWNRQAWKFERGGYWSFRWYDAEVCITSKKNRWAGSSWVRGQITKIELCHCASTGASGSNCSRMIWVSTEYVSLCKFYQWELYPVYRNYGETSVMQAFGPFYSAVIHNCWSITRNY